MSRKQILLNAFNMNCVGHIHHGMWTHPQDRSVEFNSLAYWLDLARLLERGLFDGLFIADILGVYDVYQQGIGLTARESIQLPVNDPLMLISGMASVTQHLGFGVTANLSYEAPYPFARRLSTLDHLTNGRIGWNIVTGYLDSAARAMGQQQLLAHDRRYDQADEFLDVTYQLWEGSWQDDALLADKQRRLYADAQKIHAINHQGEFYQVQGYHLSSPSPQRTPLLFQAGGSARGTRFAAEHAECIFLGAPTRKGLQAAARAARQALVDAGRAPDSARLFAMLTVIVDETAELAQARYAACLARADREGALALLSGWTGIDLSRYRPDDTLAYVDTDAGQSALASFSKLDPEKVWTVRDAVDFVAIGGRGAVVVGDAAQVADELQALADDADLDGFNLAWVESPRTFEDVVRWLVPELQRRGAYKTRYAPGTLREKLLGGPARLSAPHVGARYRVTR